MSPAAGRDGGGLARFSLDRRITVLVLVLTTLVVGGVALTGMPVELIPQGFVNPSLAVIVPYEDAPPREVEEKITLPLQEELSTVRGLDGIVAVSLARGARCYLQFKTDTDMDVAYREVRDRVERARRRFPDDVEQVFIRKEDASGIPVFVMGVAVDPSLSNSYELIQNEIILPMERTDGVAAVEAEGLEKKEILIELDRNRVAAAGLNVYALARDLAEDNFTMASGDVRDGGRKLLLRSVARYGSLEEIAARMVAPSVRLGDVASITYGEPDKQYRVRAMSKPAYAIVALKEGDANAREVSTRLAAVRESFAANPRLDGVETVVLFSQGQVIDESLSTLLQSGLVGGMIAGIVLFIFLRRLRLTLVISLAIPLSLLMALTVMYFAGETLNLISLLALMVCVGLLVDNSVVVAENIHRLRQEGASRRDACIRGAGEIALAITMSTLTTIVVFLPVALVEGQAQFFFIRLALPISVALIASLVAALVIMPLAVHLTLSDQERVAAGRLRRLYEAPVALLGRIYRATFLWLGRMYVRLLAFFLARRLDLVLGLVALFGLTMAATSGNLKFVDVQEDERHGFELRVEMPDNFTLEETEQWFLAAEAQVESHAPELGLEGWFLFHRKTFGSVQGWFANPRTTTLTPREVTEKVVELMPKQPGVKIYTGSENQAQEARGDGVHVVVLNGEDHELLERVARDLEEIFTQVDGVLGLRAAGESTPNELGLVVDRERAQRAGVSPNVVAGVVGYALRGVPLPRYLDGGREVPVRIRFQEEDREGLDELLSLGVPAGGDGRFLPLSAVTDVRMLSVPEGIMRRDKRIARTITLELEEGREKETRERLAALTGGLDLPEGVSFGTGEGEIQLDEDLQGIQFAGLLSVVFIYLLMGFLFESFILPLSIILTIPLASTGVIWIHLLAGRDIDFLGAVGIVLLIGVVVNNGIVLIDYVNRLRHRGHHRGEALLLAAQRRFRPIMMTAITTIGGLVPLALAGRGSIGISYTSFSLALIGGMSTATLLTLLVVPVFYTLFDDMRDAFGRALARVLGWGRRSPGAIQDEMS